MEFRLIIVGLVLLVFVLIPIVDVKCILWLVGLRKRAKAEGKTGLVVVASFGILVLATLRGSWAIECFRMVWPFSSEGRNFTGRQPCGRIRFPGSATWMSQWSRPRPFFAFS